MGHRLAIGPVDVPDGTAVQLNGGCDYFVYGPAVDLKFIRGLPAESVVELNLTGDFVPASFAAMVHLARGCGPCPSTSMTSALRPRRCSRS